MRCLKCASEKFETQRMRFSPEIKGEVVEVVVPCSVCKSCHEPLMDGKQMNNLRRSAADAYRKLHNLLTSDQIIQYREALGMSQAQFARYLNVGEASIKRWETYFIQDPSQDDHLRLKCDEAAAEINYLQIYWKHQEPDIYSGLKKFSLALFKNVALYLLEKTKVSRIYLNKLLFYVDFYHFKKHGKSLTGAKYIPLKYGPCPDQYKIIYDNFEKNGLLQNEDGQRYKNLAKPDLSLFDDHERATLEHIYQLFKQYGAKHLYELSHTEKGFKETAECTFISYDYAKDLKIN